MSATPPRVFDLSSNPRLRKLIEQEADEDDEERDGLDLELAWTQVLDSLPELADPDTYDLDLIRQATTQDLKAIVALINSLPPEDDDGKIEALRALLRKRPLADHERRVLIFTQYADTAIYVAERLGAMQEVGSVALIHGGVSAEARREITAWFDPARGAHAVAQRLAGGEEPRILVSTDVLAEGHNLQLARAAVNFDLHWNPQVVVQRSGRIDRLNSPHPSVHLISFLPDEGIDAHLNLIRALDERFGLIHHMGLGDEPVTPLESDIQTVTFEQLRKLYADDPNVLDEVERAFALGSTDFMRAPLEQFLMLAGEAVLGEIPVGVQSVRTAPAEWKHGEGVFVAFKFEEQTIWRFYPRREEGWGSPVTDELVLFQAIACPRAEPRAEVRGVPAGPGGVIDWDLLRLAAGRSPTRSRRTERRPTSRAGRLNAPASFAKTSDRLRPQPSSRVRISRSCSTGWNRSGSRTTTRGLAGAHSTSGYGKPSEPKTLPSDASKSKTQLQGAWSCSDYPKPRRRPPQSRSIPQSSSWSRGKPWFPEVRFKRRMNRSKKRSHRRVTGGLGEMTSCAVRHQRTNGPNVGRLRKQAITVATLGDQEVRVGRFT